MEILNTKKAQIGKKFDIAVVTIISIVVLFSLFTALVPEAQSAGNTLGDAQRCSDGGGFFNGTQELCLNGTNPADTATVAFSPIPISGLFSGSGIIIVLLMVTLFLAVFRIVMPKTKK